MQVCDATGVADDRDGGWSASGLLVGWPDWRIHAALIWGGAVAGGITGCLVSSTKSYEAMILGQQ